MVIFTIVVILLAALVSLTIANEYRRQGRFTLISILTLGNLLYSASTPILGYYLPESVEIYTSFVRNSGLEVQEIGLLRVVLAATIFQLICLLVSRGGKQQRVLVGVDMSMRNHLLKASLNWGWILVFVGITGVAWMGWEYNGTPWGLYTILYSQRSPLYAAHSIPAFFILLGIYGAAQLVVSNLLMDRVEVAGWILLGVILHAIGIKSKQPLFWMTFIFIFTAIGEKKKFAKWWLPAGLAILTLVFMSPLRTALEKVTGQQTSKVPPTELSHTVSSTPVPAMSIETSKVPPTELSRTVVSQKDWRVLDVMPISAVAQYAVKFSWNSDSAGPSSVVYSIVNTTQNYTTAPLTDIPKVLIPNFIHRRDPLLPDSYASKMLGDKYAPGVGFGWSPICDGFLLSGWFGVALIAGLLAVIGRYIDDLNKKSGRNAVFFLVVCYAVSPLFFLAARGSFSGFIKEIMILLAVVWLPTYYLYQKEYQKERRAQEAHQDR